jgi:hypothetical protein
VSAPDVFASVAAIGVFLVLWRVVLPRLGLT